MQPLLGGDCALCGGAAARGVFCAACERALPRLPRARCPVCALPHPEGGVCGACLARPPHFQRSAAALAYRFPADALVHALKYRAELALAPALARLLAAAVGDAPRPDALVAMPLHPARLAGRGFNQAHEIAKRLAARLGLPLLPRACARVRDTPPQARLPWQERRGNIRGAFASQADLSGLRIALVDDVMTSGATLDELAGLLQRRGAAEVNCWVVARALRDV